MYNPFEILLLVGKSMTKIEDKKSLGPVTAGLLAAASFLGGCREAANEHATRGESTSAVAGQNEGSVGRTKSYGTLLRELNQDLEKLIGVSKEFNTAVGTIASKAVEDVNAVREQNNKTVKKTLKYLDEMESKIAGDKPSFEKNRVLETIKRVRETLQEQSNTAAHADGQQDSLTSQIMERVKNKNSAARIKNVLEEVNKTSGKITEEREFRREELERIKSFGLGK